MIVSPPSSVLPSDGCHEALELRWDKALSIDHGLPYMKTLNMRCVKLHQGVKCLQSRRTYNRMLNVLNQKCYNFGELRNQRCSFFRLFLPAFKHQRLHHSANQTLGTPRATERFFQTILALEINGN